VAAHLFDRGLESLDKAGKVIVRSDEVVDTEEVEALLVAIIRAPVGRASGYACLDAFPVVRPVLFK
jgi:hypothetical protein